MIQESSICFKKINNNKNLKKPKIFEILYLDLYLTLEYNVYYILVPQM